MNWSDLPVFLAVARSGQLARAATALKTDATTVGRRVRRLERELGERLFEQSPLGQTLTPAGIALLARVEKMAEIVGAIAPLSAAGEGVQGSIRVSVSEGFGSWFLARHIGDLLARHPGLEIDLVANSGFLNPSRRETDVAVLLARPRRGPLIVRKLTDYTLHLYAASTYLEQHDAIGIGADARGPALFQLEEGPDVWRVRQVLDDPDGDHDWALTFEVDLAASDEAGQPVLANVAVGS